LTRQFHYVTVFDRDPWVAFASSGVPPEQTVAWLSQRGWTHVVFNWDEIERLRSTYGFPAIVTASWVETLVHAGLQPLVPASNDMEQDTLAVYRVPAQARGRE
jgi:hypothetical protein